MQIIKSKVDQGGRVLIPALQRQRLHLMPGQEIILQVEDGELRSRSFKDASKRARDIVRKYNTKNQDLVALLLAERKEDISCD